MYTPGQNGKTPHQTKTVNCKALKQIRRKHNTYTIPIVAVHLLTQTSALIDPHIWFCFMPDVLSDITLDSIWQ